MSSPEPAPSSAGSLTPEFQEPGEREPISREIGVPLIVVDGANVVGSVPDGWWRDRAGAAVRLRDSLATVPAAGLADLPGPVEVALVVEGRARDIPAGPGPVRVVRAAGSGDDTIVELAAAASGRRVVVVTADRGLRQRVTALGAEVRGPSAVPR
ncbi:hypothetical protein AB0F72_05205 [Actinoplanes sp. NPDC023936]|uniref:hypothetical protein n=1 Tax=Actinoplanes sp. NPDC023936 TaxID=3154910 RepID=UPI0033D9A6FD